MNPPKKKYLSRTYKEVKKMEVKEEHITIYKNNKKFKDKKESVFIDDKFENVSIIKNKIYPYFFN